ncbi:MAG: D-arabinono-1,4-lactone oxidase [Nocardioidaceae bacterium]
MPERNWSRTYVYGARAIHRPRSVEEVQEIVAAASRVRALGTRHSFNDLADSAGELVHLADIDPEPVIDDHAMTVSVSGAMRYGELAAPLQARGYALHNLGSLPHISVAGACATGTHGSGDTNRCLAAAVSGVEVVAGGGEIVASSRGDDGFDGMVVSLGALGVVTRLTLDIEPTYDVRQDSYVDLAWGDLRGDFDEIMASAYSVSLFTDWVGGIDQVWLKSRLGTDPEPPAAFHGATPQPPEQWSTLISDDPNLTQRGGVPGPWSQRLPHFRLDSTPSNGDEIQSEYFVAREDAAGAIDTVREVADRFAPLLMIGELRTVAADTMWLSPAYGRDTLALHFTWRNEAAAVAAVLPSLEAALEPFDVRPHWGKAFTMGADRIARTYERLDDFRGLAASLDPGGTFRNTYLERLGLTES